MKGTGLNVFNVYTADLVLGEPGQCKSRDEIDDAFAHNTVNGMDGDYSTLSVVDGIEETDIKPCLVCGKPAKYRLIPKKECLNTIELEKIGFICTECMKNRYFSPKEYGIRILEEMNNETYGVGGIETWV